MTSNPLVMKKCVFILINIVLFASISFSQAKYDTIWADGHFKVLSNLDNEVLEGVNITLRAEYVQHLEGSYTYQSVSTQYGFADFEVPVYIDSDVGFDLLSIDDIGIFPNTGNKLNIKIPDNNSTHLLLFDLSGRLVFEYELSSSASIDIGHLNNATYVYQLIGNGFEITNKFIKFTRENTTTSNVNNSKSTMNYEATYWVSWEKQNYHTDSVLMTLEEGDNGIIDLIIPYYREIEFWEDYLVFKDSETGNNVNVDVELYAWQENIDMELWDSVFYATTYSNGIVMDFSLPIYIDTIIDGYISPDVKTADYWIKWIPEQGEFTGFLTDSTIITINSNTEAIYIPIDPVPPLPQSQDLTGRVYLQDDDNNINIAVGATVYVTNSNNNETISTTTDENGDWIIYDFPINPWNDPDLYTAEVNFEYDDEHYAIEDVFYTTPQYDENTWSANDTIHSNLNALLPTKREGTSAARIGQHANRGTILDDILIYFNGVNEADIQSTLTNLTSFINETNNLYTIIESDTPVGDNGITFESNNENATTPITNVYETPWNHLLAYTSGATTSLSSPENFLVVGHEFLQGLGHEQVGWTESILYTPVQNYSEEDRIIQDIGRHYYNAAYHDQLHAIQITKLVEELNGKTKENATLQASKR